MGWNAAVRWTELFKQPPLSKPISEAKSFGQPLLSAPILEGVRAGAVRIGGIRGRVVGVQPTPSIYSENFTKEVFSFQGFIPALPDRMMDCRSSDKTSHPPSFKKFLDPPIQTTPAVRSNILSGYGRERSCVYVGTARERALLTSVNMSADRYRSDLISGEVDHRTDHRWTWGRKWLTW